MAKLGPFRPGMRDRTAYVLYMWRHRDETGEKMAVLTFAAPWAVRVFLDAAMGPDVGYVWEGDATIRTENGIIFTMRGGRGGEEDARNMRECVEHELSVLEMGFDLETYPLEYKVARNFRYDTFSAPQTEEQVKRQRAAKVKQPTVDHPAGALHVSDLALQMAIEPREARAALRKIMEKPSWGWWFKPDEIEAIKAKIKEHVGE